MDRNLALEFVRVTEASAIEAAKWMGKGDKNAADDAAVRAMRDRFNEINFQGKIVIGEGEDDDAPYLYNGETVGKNVGIPIDLAVDPLECTSNLATGRPNSMSVLAAGSKGTLLAAPDTYMDQLTVGYAAKDAIDIAASVEENILNVARALLKKVSELTVCLLDRPRHERLTKEIRATGARIQFIDHGTIAAGLATYIQGTGIDMMIGIGGAPEAVITAAAAKCMGGNFQARFRVDAGNDVHIERYQSQLDALGYAPGQVFHLDDLVRGDCMFVGTGVTNGPFLRGVIFHKDAIYTHSVVMRSKTKTIRFVEAQHGLHEVER